MPIVEILWDLELDLLPNLFADAFHEFFLITQLSSVEALDGI